MRRSAAGGLDDDMVWILELQAVDWFANGFQRNGFERFWMSEKDRRDHVRQVETKF